MEQKIPNFCPCCDLFRKDDTEYKGSPKWMTEIDILCWKLSGFCSLCFKHLNHRNFQEFIDGSIQEIEKYRNIFIENKNSEL